MNTCEEFIQLNTNKVGTIGFCQGCNCFHLKILGVLSFVGQNQLVAVENNFKKMAADILVNQEEPDATIGVQIKLSKNAFLCMTYIELMCALELIEVGMYMKKVNDLVKI